MMHSNQMNAERIADLDFKIDELKRTLDSDTGRAQVARQEHGAGLSGDRGALFPPFIYVPGSHEPLRIAKRLRRMKPDDDNWRLSIHDIERLAEICADILEKEAKW